ncbi:MAG: TetR/AcrR family transcriptional regulator [Actinomycetota bacterium]|nr:TetR/AcrR family transcriptional regulator [Actinomycetota bacterium]
MSKKTATRAAPHASGPSRTTALRADARRNQEEILRSARDLFIERGIDVPLDEVARRAGVGIGTLYRRFRDRDALVKAVLIEALEQSRASARGARVAHEGNGLDAVARYLREMLDVRVSAVIPLALDRLDDPDLEVAREASAGEVERLIDEAHEDGSLSQEVTFGDLGTLLVRLSRPLPGPMTAAADNRLAHRHLDLVLAGLRGGAAGLREKGLTRQQLGGLGRES